MGFFDLPYPLFAWLDAAIAFMPAWVRLVLWGLVAGAVTMGLFRVLSRQERIAEIKKAIKARQREMSDFDGEMSELLPLVGGTLALAFRQFGLALGPALVASIPAIFILVSLSHLYSRDWPAASEPVAVTITDPGEPPAGLAWQPADAVIRTTREGDWSIAWPAEGETVTLNINDAPVLTLPLSHPVGLIHDRRWWNTLTGNPAGYLDAELPVNAITLGLPAPQVLPAGPGWMRGWLFTFFFAFFVFSVVFKFVWRIQ